MAEVFAVLVVFLMVWFAGKILLITFGGLLLAIFLYTLAHAVSRFTPLSYGWALLVVVVLILLSTGFVFSTIGTRLAHQANEFTQALPSGLKQARDYLAEDQWGQWILEQSPDWGRAIAQGTIPRVSPTWLPRSPICWWQS